MASSNKITNEKLIEFASGELTGEEAASVNAHMNANPSAAQTVAMYRQAHSATSCDESIAPPQQLVAKAKSIFTSQPKSSAISWLIICSRLLQIWSSTAELNLHWRVFEVLALPSRLLMKLSN